MKMPMRIERDELTSQATLVYVDEAPRELGQPMNVSLPSVGFTYNLKSHGVVKDDGCVYICNSPVPSFRPDTVSAEALQSPFFHHFFSNQDTYQEVSFFGNIAVTNSLESFQKNEEEEEDGGESTSCESHSTCDADSSRPSLVSPAETPATSFCGAESPITTSSPRSENMQENIQAASWGIKFPFDPCQFMGSSQQPSEVIFLSL
jgi:hypothetical protein